MTKHLRLAALALLVAATTGSGRTGLREIDLDAAIRTVEHTQLRGAHMSARGDRVRDASD